MNQIYNYNLNWELHFEQQRKTFFLSDRCYTYSKREPWLE